MYITFLKKRDIKDVESFIKRHRFSAVSFNVLKDSETIH